jgi:4-amino-4-deoxy-L-arabinose transferase-like glycosyltransferase
MMIAGFLYRYILSGYSDASIVWDVRSYHDLALQALSGSYAVDCCQKAPGYGLFLAAVYKFTGNPDMVSPVRVMQGILDTITALMVFHVLRRIGISRFGAYFGFAIYLFNPFTAAYTGMRLPEAVSAFLVTLLGYVYSLRGFGKHPWMWIVSGVLFGLLLLVRLQFFYLSFLIILMFSLYVQKQKRVLYLALTFSGFFIVSLYSVFGYYLLFQKISLTPPYSNFYHDIYMNFYQTHRYHEITNKFYRTNPEYDRLSVEYHTVPVSEKTSYDRQFRELILRKGVSDWVGFVSNWTRNMIWLWDRYFLYVYYDPFYPALEPLVRVLNIGLLTGFFSGLLKEALRSGRSLFTHPFTVFTIVVFLYVTFLFSLVSNETRHTVFFIPILTVWAAYGVDAVYCRIRRVRTA